MTSKTPALNDDVLDAVNGGKGTVCVKDKTIIETGWGTLTLGTVSCTVGSQTVSRPFGSWQPG